MRTNLLQEELEELKTSMSASEEQKTTIVAQNKQLVSHPSSLKHQEGLFGGESQPLVW